MASFLTHLGLVSVAVEIFLASRGEGIPYPKEEVEEVEVEVVEASFVVVVVGWIAVVAAVAESDYCTEG